MDSIRLNVPQSLPPSRTETGDAASALPKVQAQAAPAVPEVEASQLPEQDLEASKMEALHKAAKTVQDYFVAGDSRFTIFKDTTGQYVTRFTSLRDGSVTYYPEPDLLKHYQQATGESLSVFSTKV